MITIIRFANFLKHLKFFRVNQLSTYEDFFDCHTINY